MSLELSRQYLKDNLMSLELSRQYLKDNLMSEFKK